MSDNLNIAPDGPFILSVELFYINEAGDIAKVEYEFPPGKLPTTEHWTAAHAAAEEFLAAHGSFRRVNRWELLAAFKDVPVDAVSWPCKEEFETQLDTPADPG